MGKDKLTIQEAVSRIFNPDSIFGLSSKTISQMTDQELAEHIKRLKSVLKVAEQTVERQRSLLTMPESQRAENEAKERKRDSEAAS